MAIAKKDEDGLKADIETANRIIAEEIETENERQKGVSVTHHRTTHPSFAYNAGKERLEVLDKVYAKKHGQDALERRQAEREAYLSGFFTLIAVANKLLISVKDKPNAKLLQKLLQDKDNSTTKNREHEVIAFVSWFERRKKTVINHIAYSNKTIRPLLILKLFMKTKLKQQ